MPAEHYFTLAITPDEDREQYTPPSWRIISTRAALAQRVREMEETERVTVTRVFDVDGREVARREWAV